MVGARYLRWHLVAGTLSSCGALAPGARGDPASATVWYRSADDCPDGAAFLARIGEPATPLTLAQVNDPIDFVVTVGRLGDRY